ncbi:hypothetical protein [Sphingomonas jaspsi]|uniref:hypothetical protein n=1 Tax=Sphingomonas jaspsi TaxID=392409 RepID=UPI0004AEB1FE|nr:hypothetical protein [Sphingomonas jaspsi]
MVDSSNGAGSGLAEDDEVATDAVQLTTVAVFNGLCRLIAALGHNGLLNPLQIDNIHDCMTAPLDDPEWRDYDYITSTRDILEEVLALAMKDARFRWDHGLAHD